jgi:hypothetical protein
MGMLTNIKVDNPGQTLHSSRVRDEVTEPTIKFTSEAGDLGALLFGHDALHHVGVGLKDEGTLQTAEGGFIEKARSSSYAPRANSIVTKATTEIKTSRVPGTASVKNFGETVKSDLGRVSTFLKSKMPAKSKVA